MSGQGVEHPVSDGREEDQETGDKAHAQMMMKDHATLHGTG